jgi:hypothetical protein
MFITTFWTDEHYAKHASECVLSAERLGLKVHAQALPDIGSWSGNLRHKIRVIRDALDSSEDVLYVDADCRFVKYPSLLKAVTADVAFHWLRTDLPHGCVIFCRANAAAQTWLDMWEDSFRDHPTERLDEVHMRYAYAEAKRAGVRFLHLPPAYAWMKGWKKRFPGADPVILHLGEGRGEDRRAVLDSAYRRNN